MTLLLTLWAAVGPMTGLLVGHFLTRSNAHELWVRDNRKLEFKAVVHAMSVYIVEHMTYAASQASSLQQSKQAYLDSMKAVYITICEQIYIHDDLFKTDIPGRFLAIMEHFRETGTEFSEPSAKAALLPEELMKLAQKD